MEWESEAPKLASLAKTTPYRVPDNYFNDLPERINQALFLEGLMQKENQGFAVPQNYFEELSSQIESRIAIEQFSALAKAEGFKTPPAYFEQLQANILSKTSEVPQKTKVFRLWHSDLMKYASAACFILLSAAMLYVNEQQTVKQNRVSELANEQMLYDIDESVIIEHIQESQTAQTTSASDTEMESYILNNFSSNDISNNL